MFIRTRTAQSPFRISPIVGQGSMDVHTPSGGETTVGRLGFDHGVGGTQDSVPRTEVPQGTRNT